jgi:hypothetical protein
MKKSSVFFVFPSKPAPAMRSAAKKIPAAAILPATGIFVKSCKIFMPW